MMLGLNANNLITKIHLKFQVDRFKNGWDIHTASLKKAVWIKRFRNKTNYSYDKVLIWYLHKGFLNIIIFLNQPLKIVQHILDIHCFKTMQQKNLISWKFQNFAPP